MTGLIVCVLLVSTVLALSKDARELLKWTVALVLFVCAMLVTWVLGLFFFVALPLVVVVWMLRGLGVP